MSRHWNFNIYISCLSCYKSSCKASGLCDKRKATFFDPFKKKPKKKQVVLEVIFILHLPRSGYDTRKKNTSTLFSEKEKLIIWKS